MKHPDVIVLGYDMNKTGEQTVTCTYNGVFTTYSIFVNESPVPVFLWSRHRALPLMAQNSQIILKGKILKSTQTES